MRKTINTAEYRALLAWLRHARLRQKLTMEEAGAKVGKPSSWVAKTENGERRLDIVEYVRYCRVLEVPPAQGIKVIQSNIHPSPLKGG